MEFEIRACAVIIENNKILLCRNNQSDYWCLPGGHVEMGELAADALTREMQEEINSKIIDIKFIGIFENIYQSAHEYNLLFSCNLESQDFEHGENHLEFEWFNLTEFDGVSFKPTRLRIFLKEWLNSQKLIFNL